MTGAYHYRRADEILAEIEAENALSIQTETTLAIQAQAHATLALAAATAIDPDRQREEWHDVAGARYTMSAQQRQPRPLTGWQSVRHGTTSFRTSSSGTVNSRRHAARRPLLR
jgi:hypothetical protein